MQYNFLDNNTVKSYSHVRIQRQIELRLNTGVTTDDKGILSDQHKKIRYNLKSVICHGGHGIGNSGGHYISYGIRENKWYLFDDQHVYLCSEKDMEDLLDKTIYRDNFYPYQLLYDQEDGQMEDEKNKHSEKISLTATHHTDNYSPSKQQ